MSRTKSLVILLVLCLMAGYALFGATYMGQLQKQRTISQQINDTSRVLALLPPLSKDSKERLVNAQQANTKAKEGMFPPTINTVQVMDTIFKAADANKVKIIPITTDPWSKRRVGGKIFNVFRLSMNIEGEPLFLLNFIKQLKKDYFPSMAVDNLIITKSSDEAGAPTTGTLDLVIFSLPASSE